ncbi:MAG: prolipoprotein diacylglyceryl transferase [Clostridia bacterium]|nr:prolipoprotein diacylglyceryl transferase [Clostridia bacterium]
MLADARWTGDIKSVAFTLFGRDIAWYGIVITFGMLVGLMLAIQRAKKLKVDSGDIMELFIFVIPFAVVFARLGYVVFRPTEFFVSDFGWSNFVDMIAVWDGGLTIMTGIPGGILGAFLWCKWRKYDFITIADTIAPVVLVSQAIGRWGNFFNQEIYGMPITNPNWQFFPVAVYIRDRAGFFQATFFYEMVLNLLFFAILVIVLKRLRVKGAGILSYLFAYPFIRFVMEFLRDDMGFYTGVNYTQIISIVAAVLSLAAIVLLAVLKAKKGEKVWYPKGIPEELLPNPKLKTKKDKI